MESLCQVEEERQGDLDSLIVVTKEKLEVSSAFCSQVWVLRAALPSRGRPS